jgi:uroporphyrinogen-III synthase
LSTIKFIKFNFNFKFKFKVIYQRNIRSNQPFIYNLIFSNKTTLVAIDNKKISTLTFFSTQMAQILKIFADKEEQAFIKKSAQILTICVIGVLKKTNL